MARYNIYAVACGVDPQTKQEVYNLKFHTWDDCKPYVIGFEKAKYKGFLSEDAADLWLNDNVPKKAKKNIDNNAGSPLEFSVVMSEDFKNICVEQKVSPKELTQFLMNQFVNQQKFIKDYN